MKVHFDESTWSELEECLKVAQICGGTANDLYGFAEGVAQRTVASLGAERDVSGPEAEHVLNVLLALRDNAAEAALGYTRAVGRIDALIDRLGPATGKDAARIRRSRPRAPKA
ncbi:hypothetical protein [Tautonia plasticadhaerens]|uniref:Uncharacterized protein n=1 Tax=Tautonia plasticadhaerens TaxID=2527974 RepID=A0A518H1V9_9BACT|nr:hypothetical protein [Tautonia plasticadhaerens]QDV34839.1 hypothetical protein ElP_27360 [Tautonia plasticadhaerens]